MYKYTIKYYYATYEGVRVVWADDEEQAVAKMWRMLSRDMTLSMASKSYEILNVEK